MSTESVAYKSWKYDEPGNENYKSDPMMLIF